MGQDITIYLAKATESLLTAESEFANGRYNRCYYACFQAAIAALLREGIRPRGQWSHAFVQAQLVGVLINQRKRYDPQLRRVLSDNQTLHDQADYRAELVTAVQQIGNVPGGAWLVARVLCFQITEILLFIGNVPF
jgi:uncharacterized protein (UPF0332 family)